MEYSPGSIAKALENLFPGQVREYLVSSLAKHPAGTANTLLHQQFSTPLGIEKMSQLAGEIYVYLYPLGENATYSFFHKAPQPDTQQKRWILSSASLHRKPDGSPHSVVIFDYNLSQLPFVKDKLFYVLDNDGFFKEHFAKVASLTKKERQITGLLANGMDSAEIAAATFTSIHTVNTHRKK